VRVLCAGESAVPATAPREDRGRMVCLPTAGKCIGRGPFPAIVTRCLISGCTFNIKSVADLALMGTSSAIRYGNETYPGVLITKGNLVCQCQNNFMF